MNYSYPQVVFSEVPGEISLALSVSGCDLHCKGCHSKQTWNKNFGDPLTKKEIDKLMNRHPHVSCILFYGGEWIIKELEEIIDYIRSRYPDKKVALYTGRELDFFSSGFLKKLDYIKTGPYRKELGALNSPRTNQRFYVLENGKIKKDITSVFYQDVFS